MEAHSATRPSPNQASASRGFHSMADLNSSSASANSPRRNRTSPANSCAAADSGASANAFCASLQAVATPSFARAFRPVARVSSSGPAYRATTQRVNRYWAFMLCKDQFIAWYLISVLNAALSECVSIPGTWYSKSQVQFCWPSQLEQLWASPPLHSRWHPSGLIGPPEEGPAW